MSPRRAGALPLLLRLDPEAKQPLNQQIYQGLRAAILDGRLRVGARLPSSRMLATDLSISRNTVLNVFLVGDGRTLRRPDRRRPRGASGDRFWVSPGLKNYTQEDTRWTRERSLSRRGWDC